MSITHTLKPRLYDTTCCQTGCETGLTTGSIIIIIIRAFVTRAVSANVLNLRRRQSIGEEDGGSEV